MASYVADWIDFDRLIRAVETEDEIGTVLRIHLAMDAALGHFVKRKTAGELEPYIDRPRYTGQRISLAAALGLPIPFLAAAREINKIRNDIAHSESVLTNAAVAKLAQQVDRIAEVNPKFHSLEKQSISLPAAMPGKKFAFGEGGARLDFSLASLAFLGELSLWLAAQGYAREV